MADFKGELAAYAAKLREDLNSAKPRVYAAVVWAYQDARVRDAIAARLEAGEVLISSARIVPDRALRRERVYFDFASRGMREDRKPGILVQINDGNSVVEIMDPFDVDLAEFRPARAAAVDTLPLLAARASLAGQRADRDAVEALRKRWADFIELSGLGSYFRPISGGPGGGALGDDNDTLCGGTPTGTDVMSSPEDKEDPDQGTQGSWFDDCGCRSSNDEPALCSTTRSEAQTPRDLESADVRCVTPGDERRRSRKNYGRTRPG